MVEYSKVVSALAFNLVHPDLYQSMLTLQTKYTDKVVEIKPRRILIKKRGKNTEQLIKLQDLLYEKTLFPVFQCAIKDQWKKGLLGWFANGIKDFVHENWLREQLKENNLETDENLQLSQMLCFQFIILGILFA